MIAGALGPYEGALRDRRSLSLTTADGRVLPLDIARYLAEADDADRTVLGRCVGPVLDVGCGPGRIVSALAAQGIAALGVDIADVAVELTVRRGALALPRDIFDRVPGEGRWRTVVVLDGNSGIGGDLSGLLTRLRSLISSTGRIVVEAGSHVPGTHEVLTARFASDSAEGPTFRWAVASVDVLAEQALECGLTVEEQWSSEGRDFLSLSRAAA
ncbi:class I SAM-dependent methyltransferase [Luteipulveratus mongoliensis]|uniref:SAM-dependent methyltransferase n=1 Tax=Luteipulveratus mongoliensis TaxID=571913 RepID=A0A0K1JR41_9MICO|nr:class I SAM-dependent methyltransferase [Luteipulveratus mongoliensis]AKU19189.1 hypothetical protein VV02_21920 [Luteipulveratus mongoliensis]